MAIPRGDRGQLTVPLSLIAESFLGRVQPIRPSVAYRLRITAVAALIASLPLIYLALICLVMYGEASYAVWGAIHLPKNPLRLFLILYLGPLLAGLILVLFLLKPILASRTVSCQLLTIDSDSQPEFFDFLRRVSAAVGASMPTRIELDNQANASASFDPTLRSFFKRDLVLTLGLPLVACLNVNQLAAVVAHEFGHFTQSAGMRFHHLIWYVNSWLAAGVHDRDNWDEALADVADGAGWLIGLAVLASRGLILLVRALLALLLFVANRARASFSRQMEFHADEYASGLAGSSCYVDTLALLPVIDTAYVTALVDIAQEVSNGSLPDDFPLFVRARTLTMAPDAREAAIREDALESSKDADHPPIAERTARIEARRDAAVFRLDAPATALFRNFPDLARSVTARQYPDWFGPVVEHVRSCPTTEALVRAGVPSSKH